LLPWQSYPRVAVDVYYADPANGIQLSESFMLSASEPEVTWRRFRMDPALNDYQIRITYLSANNRDIFHEWKVTNQDRFLVRDPRPSERVIQVIPAVNWEIASMAFVELNYIDEENSINEYRTLSFMNTPDERGPKKFSVSLVDPEKRLVSYDTSILLTDNRLIRIPRSTTAASSIFIRADMVGHRIVAVSPAELDFPSHGIIKVEAFLSYADQEAGLSFNETFSFHSAEEVSYFEFDYVEEDRSSYECQVKIRYSNGLARMAEMGSLNGDTVILPVS